MKTLTMPNIEPQLILDRNLDLTLNPRPAWGIKIKRKIRIKRMVVMSVILACLGWSSAAAEVSLETAPPVVVRTVPVAGDTDVDPALTEISVTYSKGMQDGSWSWSTWGEENFPDTTGQPKYLADGRTCVLPVKLQPGKFYATWLNSDKYKNFKDANGRPAVPYLLTFRTADSHGGPPAFGPAIETVLKSPERRVAELLDLDTGRRATSESFGENDRETHAWIREQKLDVLGVVEKGQIAVLCADMVVPPAPDNSFEVITVDQVRTNWHLAQGEPNKITAISGATDKTDTWFFQTREGKYGVLQILGQNDDPLGVKIRYKLVQGAPSPPAKKPEAKDLPALDGKSAKGLRLECKPRNRTFAVGEMVRIDCHVVNTTKATKPVAWSSGHFRLCPEGEPLWGGVVPQLLPTASPDFSKPLVVKTVEPGPPRRVLYLPPGKSVRITLDCGKFEKSQKFTGRIVYQPMTYESALMVAGQPPPWADELIASKPFTFEIVGAAKESGPTQTNLPTR